MLNEKLPLRQGDSLNKFLSPPARGTTDVGADETGAT
jgi:hypothetical protein